MSKILPHFAPISFFFIKKTESMSDRQSQVWTLLAVMQISNACVFTYDGLLAAAQDFAFVRNSLVIGVYRGGFGWRKSEGNSYVTYLAVHHVMAFPSACTDGLLAPRLHDKMTAFMHLFYIPPPQNKKIKKKNLNAALVLSAAVMCVFLPALYIGYFHVHTLLGVWVAKALLNATRFAAQVCS
jgi:hypothetical protein